jgi:hypothetical protein
MTPEEHAAALAASLAKTIDIIDDWLGPAWMDETWKWALNEYEKSLEDTKQ